MKGLTRAGDGRPHEDQVFANTSFPFLPFTCCPFTHACQRLSNGTRERWVPSHNSKGLPTVLSGFPSSLISLIYGTTSTESNDKSIIEITPITSPHPSLNSTITMSDFGPPFSPAEEAELLAAAQKGLAEGDAAEAEETAIEKAVVDMGEEGSVLNSADLGPLLDSAEAAEAEAAEAIEAAKAVDAGLDPAPVDLQDAPQRSVSEDEGYGTDLERVDEAKATASGDAEADSSILESVDILNDPSIVSDSDGSLPDSLMSDPPTSSPPTPLDSIHEFEEEGEGFFEGDPSPVVSPEGSAAQVLGTGESSEIDGGLLPSGDEGLSQGEAEEKEAKLNEKIWKKTLQKLDKENEAKYAAAAEQDQIDEGYVSGGDQGGGLEFRL